MSDADLENEDRWDFGRAERKAAVTKRRAIVSVAFHRDDFAVVGKAAERVGMRISEFIRKSALRAAQQGSVSFFHRAESITDARWSYVPERESDVVSSLEDALEVV